jgi:hypothetical protein
VRRAVWLLYRIQNNELSGVDLSLIRAGTLKGQELVRYFLRSLDDAEENTTETPKTICWIVAKR